MTIQEFLDEAVHRSMVHNNLLNLNGDEQQVSMRILVGLQETKYGIIAGIEHLKVDVEPGTVKRETIAMLRNNIAKSITNFETCKGLLPKDVNCEAIQEELKALNLQFVKLTRGLVTNKEALQ